MSVVMVTVCAARRRGWTKLRTFIRIGGEPWRIYKAATHKQAPLYSQLRHPSVAARRQPNGPIPKWASAETDIGPGDELGEDRITLGAGINPHGTTLAVVLDALADANIDEVDLRDIKVVLSQLGNRIVAFTTTLPEDERRHATPALYTEITRRCTMLGS